MKQFNAKGSIVAVVTPMREDESIDGDAFRALLEWHIKAGTRGVLVAGTTGESPTLTIAENQQLIASAVEWSGGRIPILGGVGANSTAEAVAMTRQAAADGAAAGVSVVPYYNRPPQEGLFRHFSAVADCSDMPVILYDVPKRCGAALENDTVARLAQHPRIIGIKDATGDLSRLRAQQKLAPPDFLFYSGDDGSAADFMLAGGHGVMSVTANIAPRRMRDMAEAAMRGDADAARKLDAEMRPFHAAQGAESNPIPVKWALAEDGKIAPALRLPLAPLSSAHHAAVRAAAARAKDVPDDFFSESKNS
ncbi:MAG: 4-hydroxy-tetrahydrodipicolinate synthase [Gammaproteobacteria bacterium]